MSQKKNGKDDALLTFMQNGKFFFSECCVKFFPPKCELCGYRHDIKISRPSASSWSKASNKYFMHGKQNVCNHI